MYFIMQIDKSGKVEVVNMDENAYYFGKCHHCGKLVQLSRVEFIETASVVRFDEEDTGYFVCADCCPN